MAKKINQIANQIANQLGATVVGRVPETGGGAFGAARLARAVADLRKRLTPGLGARPGRPTNPQWSHHPKVPMSSATQRKLENLARHYSTPQRKLSPMQVAAQLLEEALASCADE